MSDLRYLINHVFLPPKRPQASDYSTSNVSSLISSVQKALVAFNNLLHPVPSELENLVKMLDVFKSGTIVSSMDLLPDMRAGELIILHIHNQNAGIIIRRSVTEPAFSFEMFELSPTNEAVTETIGRLTRTFPGPSISLGEDLIRDESFRNELTYLLEKLDSEVLPEATEKVTKARSNAIEVRQTSHPRYVTEMLTAFLRANGHPTTVQRIEKHTRGDVLWDNSLLPWRRSPDWMLIRVALQTTLATLSYSNPHISYKAVMIYFMSKILQLASSQELSSEVLYIMLCKISSRVNKIMASDDPPWLSEVDQITSGVRIQLQTRWAAIEGSTESKIDHPEIEFKEDSWLVDTKLSLHTLGRYLLEMECRRLPQSNHNAFRPDCDQRITASYEVNRIIDNLNIPKSGHSLRLALHDVELWVQENLSTWKQKAKPLTSSCMELAEMFKTYTSKARTVYLGSPEYASRMILTVLEIWIALDISVLEQEPLMKQHRTGFPRPFSKILASLILHTKHDMHRLQMVEGYVVRRDRQAVPSNPSMLSNTTCRNCFAARYFEQSIKHQNLKREIEAAATAERAKKRAEYAEKKKCYADKMQEAQGLLCDTANREVGRVGQRVLETYHPSNCRKCRLKAEANTISIEAHEWPLPGDANEACVAVFELFVPLAIREWRDTTYSITVDLLSPPMTDKFRDPYWLDDFKDLQGFVRTSPGRLRLASQVKPFYRSHFSRPTMINANEDNVCVRHASRYTMMDFQLKCRADYHLDKYNITKICTFQLGAGPLQSLQCFLSSTHQDSNLALASQHKCQTSMTLHEYYSFVSLRAGDTLQWCNIARELIAGVLDFNREETFMLVTQAIWQAGDPDWTVYRRPHRSLEDEVFGMHLISAVNTKLTAVESNWQASRCVRTLTALASRLLSLSPHESVQEKCLKVLQRARDISFQWIREIKILIHSTPDEKELTTLNPRALQLALTCHGTFNVDQSFLIRLLKRSGNIAVITECIITMYNLCPENTNTLSKETQVLIDRSLALSHRVEPLLRAEVLKNREGLDSSISSIWDGYKPGSTWQAMATPNERWLISTVEETSIQSSGDICFNTLNGDLLVNGSPIGRLPLEFQKHATFQRHFSSTLDVVPSSMPGMRFETQLAISGQQVHFVMHKGELIIRTKKGDQIHELLPQSALKHDFPAEFVKNFSHWLNISTGSIEFRSLENTWQPSPNNWQSPEYSLSLIQGHCKLVDVRSTTAKNIARLLEGIEDASNIHTLYHSESSFLEVQLPRLNLDFYVPLHGQNLQSKQFRGMAVDTVQGIGCLTGLRNKLVLSEVKGNARIILVPDGKPSCRNLGNHLQVTIQKSQGRHTPYHTYHVNTLLGRLEDNHNMSSRLFRILLHASTSHCLPDTLTGRTGTEEALYGLSRSSMCSVQELHDRDIELLLTIHKLTPARTYYPPDTDKKVMQTVYWSAMPAMSQHDRFSREVESILKRLKHLYLFQPQSKRPKVESRTSPELLEKAAIRSLFFRVSEFGAQDFTSAHDIVYESRDVHDLSRETDSCHMVKLAMDWSQDLTVCSDLLTTLESLSNKSSSLGGPDKKLSVHIGFDKQMFSPFPDFLANTWGSLHKFLTASNVLRDKHRIMVFLLILRYSQIVDRELCETLLAFATVAALRTLPCPAFSQAKLSDGYQPDRNTILSLFRSNLRGYSNSPESCLPLLPNESAYDAKSRRRKEYDAAVEDSLAKCVDHVMNQWPGPISILPDLEEGICRTHIKMEDAIPTVLDMFNSWRRNIEIQDWAQKVQQILQTLNPSVIGSTKSFSMKTPERQRQVQRGLITFDDLLAASPSHDMETAPKFDLVTTKTRTNPDRSNLDILLGRLSALQTGAYEVKYIQDLRESTDVFCATTTITDELQLETAGAKLAKYQEETNSRMMQSYKELCASLQPRHQGLALSISRNASLWPRISSAIILSHLASPKLKVLSKAWRRALVQYALSISQYQKACRLVACGENISEFLSEINNVGHLDWDPMENPDWLLFEIENNMLIRQDQSQIARQMITPVSGHNSLTQLNMGLGKSSVIVPISALNLADGKQLARIVVLRPLSRQMFDLLVEKLAGILDRRIFYMPITRSMRLSLSNVQIIRKLYETCMKEGGLLLVQPEHLLSFELMGIDQKLFGERALGEIMVKTQTWLDEKSRDILNVKFELIYTMGNQTAIDYSPDRWLLIELVLRKIGDLAPKFMKTFPLGLEVIVGVPGSFPRIRITDQTAGDELLKYAAETICREGLPGVPLQNLSKNERQLVYRFITDPRMSAAEFSPSKDILFSIHTEKMGLLLLRGLFANGVLYYAFSQKRWRVNYGLDPSRTMLAVPYHAKDTPSPRSEFSHPDTAIVLTCLSYQYAGLTNDQVYSSFKQLLLSDQSQQHYEKWTSELVNFPPEFAQLSGINLSNARLCLKKLFPIVRHARNIDYFMSYLVFPKEMKEFSHKHSSSSWQIAKEKQHPTTGFSGTNDSKHVLPSSIEQYNLPHLRSTNASVIDTLLRPENKVDFTYTASHETPGASTILDMAIKIRPRIQVILDVGAQVLELQNEEIATVWLSRVAVDHAQAVIFFDNYNDELCVKNRDGLKERLVASPFVKQMDQCLVFLDEAHTRGTDLKLPSEYRAMVTLGPDLSKDRFIQACMRMRKLGQGQSVILCGPNEVQERILQITGKKRGDTISMIDVLQWCISNTWHLTRKSVPLWATQGVRHYRRQATIAKMGTIEMSVLEKESQSLEQRYSISGQPSEEKVLLHDEMDNILSAYQSEIQDIRQKCRDFGLTTLSDATLQEEQERELQPEQEREQQTETSPAATSRSHSLHPSVQNLAELGDVDSSSEAFLPAFKILLGTTFAKLLDTKAWPQDLLVIKDFLLAIKQDESWVLENEQAELKTSLDFFMRPVHWIITTKTTPIRMVIISPYEANCLLPDIRKYGRVNLHIYSPRLSLSHSTLEHLRFCAIPSVPPSWEPPQNLVMQLNIFSGQLYLRSYAEYTALCKFLGLISHVQGDDTSHKIAADGFVLPNGRSGGYADCQFSKSPIELVRGLISIRRKGQEFITSHMGRILNGEMLKPEDFEE
ncbi:hypothetical protein BP5796_00093 [Coleophoma crateriformis]|uniref:ubiquitinyl hydrolase 1 n=1 Tax=Coleophoma crateriformis TaxID=565419 RepID=A0A3D8T725_9HELO|nr:hypothetical protein BP5796_00093 [Coleophoma crateriformis]